MNIPIYRAKKIGSDEYVEGYHHSYRDKIVTDDIVLHRIVQKDKPLYMFYDIDPTTLSIHFPDMLDSQGNKIFASLSEDGKGGDILYYEDDCQPYICEHSSDGTFLFEYLDDKTIKNYICRLSGNKVLFEDLKVIGIQE